MCRRTSPNNTITTNINNNNNVAVGGNYSLPFQRWPTYRTATSTMETLPGNRATSAMETLSGNRATTAAAAATAASAIENLRVGRATTAATTTTTTATALMQTLPIEILKQIGAFAGGCFSLGETCKANLEVTSELHYAINIMENAYSFSAAEDPMGALSNRHMMGMKPPGASFSFFANHNAHDPSGGSLLSNRHMMGGGGVKPPLGLGVLPNRDMAGGVKRPGALATGRIVTRITVTGCTDLKDTYVSAIYHVPPLCFTNKNIGYVDPLDCRLMV